MLFIYLCDQSLIFSVVMILQICCSRKSISD